MMYLIVLLSCNHKEGICKLYILVYEVYINGNNHSHGSRTLINPRLNILANYNLKNRRYINMKCKQHAK